MKKNDPHPATEPLHETTSVGPRLQLVTWQEEEARLERLRRERTRSARAIYIPPFPVSQDLTVSQEKMFRQRWNAHVPPSLKLTN